MSNPITWQTVNPVGIPDGRGLAYAQQSFKDAIGSLRGVVDQRNAMEDANWKTGKEANTNAFLNRLQQFQTPEEAQAAIKAGDLGAMLDGFGAQVDGVAARTAQMSLVENLQRRATANQQYGDQQQEVKQRDVVAGLQNALQNASSTEEANNIKQAIGIYRDGGYLSGSGATGLFDKALAREQGLVKQGRDNLIWDETQKTWIRAAADEAFKALERPKKLQQMDASIRASNAQASAARGTADTAFVNARARELTAAADLAKAQGAQVQSILDTVPGAKRVGTYKGNLGGDLEKDFKLDPGFGTATLSAIKKKPVLINGKAVDVPVDILRAAITEEENNSWWRSGKTGFGENVRNRVQKLMDVPANAEEYAGVNVALANIQSAGKTKPPPQDTNKLSANEINLVTRANDIPVTNPSNLSISTAPGLVDNIPRPTGKLTMSVLDGDTIRVSGEKGKPISFRLKGIDAQETAKPDSGGQRYSEDALKFVRNALSSGKAQIQVSQDKTDDKGRYVADVFINGVSVNEALLNNGLATVLDIGLGPHEKARKEEMQRRAIAQRLNMHGAAGTNAGAPAGIFRRMGDPY